MAITSHDRVIRLCFSSCFLFCFLCILTDIDSTDCASNRTHNLTQCTHVGPTCANIKGVYVCSCPPGFLASGEHCVSKLVCVCLYVLSVCIYVCLSVCHIHIIIIMVKKEDKMLRVMTNCPPTEPDLIQSASATKWHKTDKGVLTHSATWHLAPTLLQGATNTLPTWKAQVRKGPRGEGKRNEEEHELRITATKNAESYWMMTKLVRLLDRPALLQLDDAKQQTTQLGRLVGLRLLVSFVPFCRTHWLYKIWLCWWTVSHNS